DVILAGRQRQRRNVDDDRLARTPAVGRLQWQLTRRHPDEPWLSRRSNHDVQRGVGVEQFDVDLDPKAITHPHDVGRKPAVRTKLNPLEDWRNTSDARAVDLSEVEDARGELRSSSGGEVQVRGDRPIGVTVMDHASGL